MNHAQLVLDGIPLPTTQIIVGDALESLRAMPCILAGCPRGGVVLDPFGGSGRTALVANRLGRNAILIELNPAYAEMARELVGGAA